MEAAEGTEYSERTTRWLSPDLRGECKQGQKCEWASQGKARLSPSRSRPLTSQGPSSSSSKVLPQGVAAPAALRAQQFPRHSCAERLQAQRLSGALRIELTSRVARRTRPTSGVPLRLPKSVVCTKLQDAVPERPGPLIILGKRWRGPASLLPKSFRQRRTGVRSPPLHPKYPQLVGKRIRHLFEEKDKTEAWYRGVVLRVHQHHRDPLKTVYEVKYDSEPGWRYHLEILQDYRRGWLEVEE